ncbi:phage tail tube protein [Schlesneria sp. T3-172]|uniref:phage tail tube protein n=1 Tax=Schlesneria sphaerica TaxID=3373610 RepID=UPI0037C8B6F8
MTESMGWASALAMQPMANIANTTAFSSSSSRLEFVSCDLAETIPIEQDDGLRGTRTRAAERLAQGNIAVGGSIVLEPTPVELETIMPFIMGTASSSGTYALADTLPFLYLLVDYTTKVNTFTTKVSRATFSASPGRKLQLKLDLVGTVMTIGNAGTFASASIPAMDLTARPWMMYDLGSGVTINSLTYSIDRFELIIDNMIDPTYMQGQTATDLEPADRIITLGMQTKFTSTEVVLQTDTRAKTGRAASLAFTNGSNILTMTFAQLVAMAESVKIPGRSKLRLPLNYQCYGLSTTKELVVTLPN